MIYRMFGLVLLALVATTGCALGTTMGWGHRARSGRQVGRCERSLETAEPFQPIDRVRSFPAPAPLIRQAGHQVVEPSALITLGPTDDLNTILYQNQGIVLVDFFADWCGPCRRQSAMLHELEPLARQNGSHIIKVNIDAHPDLARQYQVSRLPTLILIQGGAAVQRQTGLVSKDQLTRWLSR